MKPVPRVCNVKNTRGSKAGGPDAFTWLKPRVSGKLTKGKLSLTPRLKVIFHKIFRRDAMTNT